MEIRGKKIAFIVGVFPAVSETFIIDQIADLLDRGIEVEIFAFKKGDLTNISGRYFEYDMKNRTRYLQMPKNRLIRIFVAIPKIIRMLILGPSVLMRALDVKKYGSAAHSLRYLFWSAPFVGERFDLVHCHFATIADDFLVIRDIVGIPHKFITTFYGYDASYVFKNYPSAYERLKKESLLFLVMSEDMKKRIIEHGFSPDKIRVLPVGIKPDNYLFKERVLSLGEKAQIISVGRFVEKKGFDDLLRALAIVKQKIGVAFCCTIVGDGPLREQVHGLADSLEINDVIKWKGFMPIEKIINLFSQMHFFVQPSKTAVNGDME